MTTLTWGCSCSADAGRYAVTGPSTIPATASALDLAGRHEHEVTGLQDRADTLGEDVLGDLVGRGEEAGIVAAGLSRERLQAGARRQRRSRLVEGDVPVAADAEDLEVDPPGLRDRRLVGGTSGDEVGSVARGPVDASRVEVDARRELALDHGAVGLRMASRQTDVLVEQERRGGGERQLAGGMATDELVVDRQRGAAGGQSEHCVGTSPDQLLDGVGDDDGHRCGR